MAKRRKKKNISFNLMLALVIIVFSIVAILAVLYFVNDDVKVKLDTVFDTVIKLIASSSDDDNAGNNKKPSNGNLPALVDDCNVSVHFLELGNKYTGDCTLIKCGDVEVLIDAGSRQSSSKTIKEYVDQYCTDGILEYVIVTHAHQDHIAGFVGSKENPGVFESYVCETIIDFPKTNATSSIYKNYIEPRFKQVQRTTRHLNAGMKRTAQKENIHLARA